MSGKLIVTCAALIAMAGTCIIHAEEPVFNTESVAEYRRRAEKNDPEGLYWYAKALAYGLGTKENPEKAVVLAQKSADQNFAPGINLLGVFYKTGLGVDEDYFKAAKLFKQAVALGDVKAKYNLGDCYFSGDGVPKNTAKALQFWEDAANGGAILAMNRLGRYYSDPPTYVRNQEALEFKWFSRSADLGDDYGKARLAWCYIGGIGCERDYEKGLAMFQSLASKSNSFAECSLGNMYEKGTGVARDIEMALEWYRRAASHGNEHASKCIKKLEDKYYSKKTIAARKGFVGGASEPDSFCGFAFGQHIEGERADDGSACVVHRSLKKPFRKFHSGATLYGGIASKKLFKIEMYSETFSDDISIEDRVKEYEETRNVLSRFYRITPKEGEANDLSVTTRGRGKTLGGIVGISWHQRLSVYELGHVVITLRWEGENRMWLTAVHKELEKQAKEEAFKEMKSADGSEAL